MKNNHLRQDAGVSLSARPSVGLPYVKRLKPSSIVKLRSRFATELLVLSLERFRHLLLEPLWQGLRFKSRTPAKAKGRQLCMARRELSHPEHRKRAGAQVSLCPAFPPTSFNNQIPLCLSLRSHSMLSFPFPSITARHQRKISLFFSAHYSIVKGGQDATCFLRFYFPGHLIYLFGGGGLFRV